MPREKCAETDPAEAEERVAPPVVACLGAARGVRLRGAGRQGGARGEVGAAGVLWDEGPGEEGGDNDACNGLVGEYPLEANAEDEPMGWKTERTARR